MKTHPLNVSYLVVGLIYLGVAGSWALRESGVVDLGEIQWLLPLTLVVAGLVGLGAAATRSLGRRDRGEEDLPPYDGYGTDDRYDHHQGDDR
jgi:hypothetical protein